MNGAKYLQKSLKAVADHYAIAIGHALPFEWASANINRFIDEIGALN
jgi:hypothetical protein